MTKGDEIEGVRCNGELFKDDSYVVALGSYNPALLKPLDIQLPVYPVKGYSLTFPIDKPAFATESTIMDETYKVAVTRYKGLYLNTVPWAGPSPWAQRAS